MPKQQPIPFDTFTVKFMNLVRLLLILLCACACGALAGCGADSDAKTQRAINAGTATPSAPQPVVVNVVEAREAPVAGDLLIPAALAVENTALVLAQRDGTIVRLDAAEGQRVAQGQTLAGLNDEEARTQQRQLELEVSRLQIEEQQYKALVNVNRNELERATRLARDGIISKADVERAQYQLEVSSAEYERTRLATQGAQVRIEGAKLELAKSLVNAPRAGVVTHRYVSLGTSVVKNDKLFEIAQLTPLTVKFQVPQAGAVRLNLGQSVALSLTDERAVARARIRRIDPVADAASSTIGYLADVSGGTGLLPGLTVNVHIPRADARPAIWLPRAAFPTSSNPQPGTTCTLFVLDGDRSAAREVWINSVQGDQVEIGSGLQAGERVILPPAELKVGDVVRAN